MSDLEENFKNLPFEEKIKIMDSMTEKQKNDGIEQVKYICKDYCGKCPSYEGTGETNLCFLFNRQEFADKRKKRVSLWTMSNYSTDESQMGQLLYSR